MNLEASFYPYVLSGIIMGAMLIAGFVLRFKVHFFRKFLIPAGIIGGVLGFLIKNYTNFIEIDFNDFAIIAYHLFTLEVIAMGLTSESENSENKLSSFSFLQGTLWLALVYTVIFCAQCIFGGGIVYAWNQLTGSSTYPGLGFLTGYGFAQGMGQTLAIGAIWEQSYQIQDAISIGLTFAVLGSLSAFFIGIPIVNRGVRRGKTHFKQIANEPAAQRGVFSSDNQPSAGFQTTHPANVDTLAFHVALILIIYGLCYLTALQFENWFGKNIGEMAFGFLFVFGLLYANLTRFLFKIFRVPYLIDAHTLKRISVSLIDFLMIPTIMAIQILVIQAYVVPIVAASIFAVFIAYYVPFVWFKPPKLPYHFERSIAIFGNATGTLANGLLLLKIVDSDFKTSAATELILFNFFAIPFVLPLILLVGKTPENGNSSTLFMAGVYVVTLIIAIVLLFFQKKWLQNTKHL